MIPQINPSRNAKLTLAVRTGEAILILAVSVVALSTASLAQSDKVKAGLDVWRNSGCADCHGPFADGDKEVGEAPTGADIRTAKLDAAALKVVISCGRPGGAGMPAFDEGAYKVRACYGQPLGEEPSDLYPSGRKLTPEQIDAVIAYLQARIIGRGRITKEECLAYYYDQEGQCDDLP